MVYLKQSFISIGLLLPYLIFKTSLANFLKKCLKKLENQFPTKILLGYL